MHIDKPVFGNASMLNPKVCFILLTLAWLTGCNGGSGDSTPTPIVTETFQTNEPPASFSATRQLITEGEATTLQWDSPESDSVSIEPDIGTVPTSGERIVSPAVSTQYILTATKGDSVNQVPLDVNVRPLAAVTLLASAATGDAPLTVRFTPEVDSSTAINRLYWDFEGDGGVVDGGVGDGVLGFDKIPRTGDFDVVGRELTYTFDEPGTYTTRVRVWDVSGNQAESDVTIEVRNAPPAAQVRVSPTTGTAPLNTIFTVTATDNEGIASYEWDIDGDGVYEDLSTSRNFRHTYETPGEFKPRVRITDELGETTVLEPLHLQVNARLENVPRVTVSARPNSGPAPLTVSLSASTSTHSTISAWAWDFNGDGRADSSEAGSVEFTYDQVGTYYPTVTVQAEDGSLGRDIFSVVVSADHSLEVVDATINPDRGQLATIALSLNGSSETELVVEGRSGVIRTLAPWEMRATGEYTFQWDGKDATGTIAAPGAYHVVLRYREDDTEKVLDLRTTTGGLVFYPSGWPGGNCSYTETEECGVLSISDNPIQPFADNPAVIDFTTPYNARVTAYVTVIGSEDFAPATFYRSFPLAQGSYTIEWFGEGTDGRLLPQRTTGGYLPAVYGTTASDNAIYLNHTTRLVDLSVEPPIFYPSTDSSHASISQLKFGLTRTANVIMKVDSVNAGAEVYRREFANVPAGSNNLLEWDGRIAGGELLAPGGYRISLIARDKFGQESLPLRAMQRIQY